MKFLILPLKTDFLIFEKKPLKRQKTNDLSSTKISLRFQKSFNVN